MATTLPPISTSNATLSASRVNSNDTLNMGNSTSSDRESDADSGERTLVNTPRSTDRPDAFSVVDVDEVNENLHILPTELVIDPDKLLEMASIIITTPPATGFFTILPPFLLDMTIEISLLIWWTLSQKLWPLFVSGVNSSLTALLICIRVIISAFKRVAVEIGRWGEGLGGGSTNRRPSTKAGKAKGKQPQSSKRLSSSKIGKN